MGRHVLDALTFQPNLSSGNPTGWLKQTNDRGPGQRFTCTGFSDHSENLSRFDRERHVIDSQECSAPGWEFNSKVFHL
jgi:hypothetical protein